LYTGFRHPGPAAVRYPRGSGPGVPVEPNMMELPIGEARVLRDGTGCALLAFGSMVEMARPIAARMNATLIDMRFVKPLDEEMIRAAAHRHEFIVTIEENALAGGAGSGVNEILAAAGLAIPVLNIGLDDSFIEHGSREECLRRARLDTSGIQDQIEDFTRQLSSGAGPGVVRIVKT